MIDFKLYSTCDHQYFEELTIEGSSPNYYADLTYESNRNIDTTSILSFNHACNIDLFAMNGEGISNFYFSSGTQINFGVYPVDAGMQFPDPNPDYIPQNTYYCSYTVRESQCPKCKGTKRYNDVHIDNTGRIETVTSANKIRQQILKCLQTLAGNNIYDDAYGSITSDLIGSRIDAYATASLQFSILDAINHLIDIQIDNNVPDTERITSIANIKAERDLVDPRRINIVISVRTANYETVSTSIIMTTV